MRRTIQWPMAATALALMLVGCSGDKNGQDAVEGDGPGVSELEGVWHVESAMLGGKPKPIWLEEEWTFVGDQLITKSPRSTIERAFVTDPAVVPKTVDITSTIAGQTETRPGIYHIEGDTLRICNRAGDNERPGEFQSTREGGELLLVLKKGLSTEQESCIAAQMKRLEDIGGAMVDFARAHGGKAPAQAIRDADGNSLLSWRVALLPHMKQKELYDQFRLDEPWDSEHNKALLEKMPDLYKSVGVDAPGMTTVMVFAAEGTEFGGPRPPDLKKLQLRDPRGRSMIMMTQAGPDKAVPWTKPEDLPLIEENPITALGELTDAYFPVLLFAGYAEALPKDIDPKTLRLMIRPEPGVPVEREF